MEYVLRIVKWPKFTVDAVVLPVVLLCRHLYDHFIPHWRNNYQPHLLRGRALVLFAVLLLSVKMFTLSALAFAPAGEDFSSAVTSENILSLTNLSRKAFGFSELTENIKLAEAAQAKANDMQAKAYFAHTSPDGLSPWNFIQNAGYNYLIAGENLAINFYSADNMEEAWMNSPGHKANILNKNFEETGVGVSRGEYGNRQAIFVVQMFGVSAEQKIQLTDTSTKLLGNESKPMVLGALVVYEADENLGLQGNSLSLNNLQVTPKGSGLQIFAKASENAVKVLAHYGQKAVLLTPKGNGLWQAEIPLASLPKQGVNLNIAAFDITGQNIRQEAGVFSQNINENYNFLAVSTPAQVELFGQSFKIHEPEQKVYLVAIVVVLVLLILALGIRKQFLHINIPLNAGLFSILSVFLSLFG